MAGGGDVAVASYAADRRKALTGKSGWVRFAAALLLTYRLTLLPS